MNEMAEGPLRRCFDLPADVEALDFVHQIDRAASSTDALAILDDYVVTPSIARNLARAIEDVRRGVEARRSVFTWIHGSFGSGKSHFMNVLSLLLADRTAVFARSPELRAHRDAFGSAVVGQSLFRLHVQCISRQAMTVEEIVFGAAVEEIARRHPGAPPPALFATQKLFEGARRLLDDLGEARFFGAFPATEAGGKSFTRGRFEAAIAAPGSTDARELAGALTRTPWFEGVSASASFVKLGPGLAILAEHLKGLGYDGVVLLLDELVLWLSTLQDPQRRAQEAPKVSTLVEHGDYPPALPYLTFAARQRDLSEMMGTLAAGRDELIFRDHLSFWKDRFELISLEDKDLPRIIEKRVLKVKAGREAEIDAAFEAYKRAFAADFRELHEGRGDAGDFRRLYPLTPALVEVMVALSATLQRGRTALRELTHLLVRYLPDFELGRVVPLGDLFDVVVHGQASEVPAIQRLYEQALRVYEGELLPPIRRKNKTDTPARCQLLRDGFDARLGCAGCAEKACRAETRIAKTVLLQGIVPNTPALKNLTAAGLVHLNSGTLKSKVPNQETAMAAALVRAWAGVTPAVRVLGDVNPEVRAVLDAIDVRRILAGCRDLGTLARQRACVREILFAKMAVSRKDRMGRRTVEWRGRKWHVGVVYESARLADDDTRRPGEGEDLRVLIGAPFDDEGDGEAGGRAGAQAERGVNAIVWRPERVGEETRQAIVDLTTLEGLCALKEQELADRVSWVSLSEMARVRAALEQQRAAKRALVEDALAIAYGVRGAFDRALEAMVQRALGARAPRHPVFGKQPTRARLEAVLELLDRVLATPAREARFDGREIEELGAIAAAEHLGIVRVIEDQAIFLGGLLDQVTRSLAKDRRPLSVGAVRAALDPDGLMDLSVEVQDFLVLAYAKAAPRPLSLLAEGRRARGLIGKLSDDLALVPVALPGQESFQRALAAAALVGVAPDGKGRSPSRVEELVAALQQKAARLDAERIADAIEALGERQRMAGVPVDVRATPRGEALAKLGELVSAANASPSANEVVEALARLGWEEARAAAITSMAGGGRVQELRATLGSPHLFAPVEALRKLAADPARGPAAARAMERVRAALVSDEDTEPLRPALEREAARITALLADGPPPPAPARSTQRTLREAREALGLVEELVAKLERGERLRVTIETLDREGE